MIAPSLSTFRIKPQISTYSLSDDPTQEIENIPGKLWIDKVHFAFDEADTEHKGALNLQQFKQSRLKFLITKMKLNDYQMENYFRQIDSNGIDLITWKELVDFLMSYQRSLTAKGVEKVLKIEFIGPDERTATRISRTMIVLRTLFIPFLSEVAVLCESALIFYSIEDMKPTKIFTEHSGFVDCVYLPCIYKIAICKQNREIIFYDVRGGDKISFNIAATMDIDTVIHMNIQESRKASKWCHRREIPLFNRPTAIGGHPKHPYIFVGDEKGRVEVFFLCMTAFEGHYDWSSKRVAVQDIHTDDITQITYLPSVKSFASTSVDGSIALWKFNFKTNKLVMEYTFQNPQKLAIRSFVYDERTHDIVYNTSVHCFGVWRTHTNHQTTIETHSQVIQTMAIYQMGPDQSFLITVTESGFYTIYRMPGMEQSSNFFMGLMHHLCPPTKSIIVDKRLFLAGAFLSAWQLENGDCDGFRPHNNPIISAFTNDVFNSVISIDNNGDVCNWNYVNGRKEYWYTLQEPGIFAECACLDQGQRRMAVGFSDGHVKIVSANSGSILNEIDKEHIEGGCHYICFATIFGQKRILCCSGVRSIILFEDISGSRTRFVRSFIGHTENVNRALVLKNSRVLSIGMEKEMFLWKVQTQNPIMRYQLPSEPSVATDLPDDDDRFLIGDVEGNILFMSMQDPLPLAVINAFHMSIKSPITTMTMCSGYPLLVAANLHGYIKYWFFLGDTLEDFIQFRGHTEMTLSISISKKMRVVVSSGRDEQIRMWSVEPFGLIGSFGRGKFWKINHLDMWESDQGLPEDPMHFADPEEIPLEPERFIEEEEVQEKTEEEEIKEKFDYFKVNEIYETTEHYVERGKKINAKAEIVIKEPPLSERRPPRKPLITFDQFMENRDMDGTIRKINRMLKPKITKPSPGKP
ncbi:EF hand family protein [Tritrichomonas foetus]|uniref:EF hand family protein n=1 Tax=Tritrichomonas foetus TaxID=1144522 RepID=A0A1J4KDZ7_9EUKA|nr:EF hand family protein [Tritrichomonas foetus]|eukprot:OHT09419.1 EF hand family protein [Tritrichomonas foetus]